MRTLRSVAWQRPSVFALVVVLLTAMALTSSPAYADDSPTKPLDAEETDQLYDLLTQQDDELALLRIDLRAMQEHAAIDSMLAARKLELLVEGYEVIIDGYKKSRPSFLERLVKEPIIWLALGTWFGSAATR